MKHTLIFIFSVSLMNDTISQITDRQIDSIQIKMKDTIYSYQDFILQMNISKKNSDSFLFPINYMVGEDFNDADLLFQIQKKNRQNKFVYYRCDDSPIPIPSMNNNPKFKFGVYKDLILFDSLDVLQCIEQGRYRVRVLYNIRVDGGIPMPPTVFSASNWYYIYVDAKEKIILSSYLRMRLKEIEGMKHKKKSKTLRKLKVNK